MSKVANMLNMLQILKDNNIHSINELSEKLEVSKRMIRVYKYELEQAGIYINSERGKYGGYLLDRELNNIDIGITIQDITLLNSVKSVIAKNNNADINFEFDKFIKKIRNAYCLNLKLQDETKIEQLEKNKKCLTQIYKDFRTSINNKSKVFIEYNSHNSGKTKRIIHPAELFNYLEDWYVVAFCEKRREIRMFKLESISNYKILKDKYNKKIKLL